MALRVPFPWEKDQATRRVELDLPEFGRSDGLCGVPGAEEVAARLAPSSDPNRARRGATGAANAVFEESQARGWGLTREQCRDRVNRARATCAAKKRR